MTQLQINSSIVVMLGIFVVVYFLLSNIALKRLTSHLVERDHRLSGREEEAKEIQGRLEESRLSLAAEMKQAQIQASEAFAEIRQKAVEEQRRILGAAKENGAAEIKKARDEATLQMKNEMTKLESEIPKLARLVLDQILQTKGSRTSRSPNVGTEA